jgi:hypothetical protein
VGVSVCVVGRWMWRSGVRVLRGGGGGGGIILSKGVCGGVTYFRRGTGDSGFDSTLDCLLTYDSSFDFQPFLFIVLYQASLFECPYFS